MAIKFQPFPQSPPFPAMLDARLFRDLVSGQRRGVGAAVGRAVLAAAEIPYSMAVSWRNRRYDRGKTKAHRVAVPVICVGNLTLGGTGKTPAVRWIARLLGERGLRAAIVSRGYGTRAGQPNDEALELEQALPEVPHVQNPDRVAAAQVAARQHNAQAILLDDGFQHRRLARDLDIVLLDALEPFGHGRVFPRGLLREPIRGLSRADVVMLSRADLISAGEREAIQRRVKQLAPDASWCEVTHAPHSLISASGHREPISTLANAPVAAFCGIGNPAGFRGTLDRCDIPVAAWREFPDHHAFTPEDASVLATWARDAGAAAVLCTQKDLVKLCKEKLGGLQLWAVEIEIDFLAGRESLVSAVDRVIPKPDYP